MINNLGDDYKHSIVIGIEGEWGSGKSSFIELILGRIDPQRPESKESADSSTINEHNLVVEFNPWNFSNQNELIKDFFGSIAEGLNQIYKEDTNRRAELKNNVFKWFRRQSVTKMLGGYASKLLEHSEIELAPTVSLLGVLNFRFKAVWNFRQGNKKPLEQQRDEIVKKFETLGKRVVIVVDDIDRLDKSETKLIFKLVKLATNFPNTVFLLAYDRIKVGERLDERGIAEQDSIKGEEYLKKIVQLPFLIPRAAPEDIYSILHSAIGEELDSINFDRTGENMTRLPKIVYTLEFRKLFQTIRDIKRYANSLRLDLRIIDKEEINMGDFLGVEAIRVFAPETYLAMSDKGPFLTVTTPSWEYLEHNEDQKDRLEKSKKTFAEVVGKAPIEIQAAIQGVISQLLPQHGNSTYPSGGDITLRNERRVCSSAHFDTYFRLGVPVTRISEVEMNKFLLMTDDSAAITVRLCEFHKENKLELLIEKLTGRLDKLDNQQLENLLVGTFDFIDRVQEPPWLDTFSGPTTFGGRLAIQLLNLLESSELSEFLVSFLNRVKNFLVTTRLIRVLDEISKDDKEPLLTKNGMVPANSIWLKKIKVAAGDGSLGKSSHFWAAISYWKHLGKEKDVEAYIMELLSSKEGLFDFLKGIMSYRTSSDGYTTTITGRIQKKTIENFNAEETLEMRINELDESTLTEEEKEIVEIYRSR